jgi:hypothetical protein
MHYCSLPTPHDLAMCLGPWILASMALGPAVASIYAIGWIGLCLVPNILCVPFLPTIYFNKEINCHALYVKYASQGVQLQGSITKKWQVIVKGKKEPVTNVQVLYQVGEFLYSKVLQLPAQQPVNDEESSTAVDLVLMPGYPKSAILYAVVKVVDPDFPPHARDELPWAIFLTTFFASIPYAILLWGFDLYNAWLTILVIIPVVVLSFACAYWFTTRSRDNELHQLLYGAKPEDNGNGAVHILSKEDRMSYEEFCQLDHSHRPSYGTILRVAVEGTLWCAYYVPFLGCFLVWYGIAVPRWKRALLQLYDSESDIWCVVGSIACKQDNIDMNIAGVIVQYRTTDNQIYKKRLILPLQVRQGMPESPELIYLKDLPKSVIYKGTVLDQLCAQNAMKRMRVSCVCGGLLLMMIQVGIPIWIGSILELALWIAGTLLVCNFVMGYVGVWIRYHTVIERELLGGAKLLGAVAPNGRTLMRGTFPPTLDLAWTTPETSSSFEV